MCRNVWLALADLFTVALRFDIEKSTNIFRWVGQKNCHSCTPRIVVVFPKLWLQTAPPLTLNDCAQLAHSAPQVAVKFFWLITPWKAWRWRIFERPKLSVLRWFRDINYTSIYINTMMIPLDSRMVIVIPGYSTVNHGEWQNHTVLICFIAVADGNDEWHQVAFKTLRSYAGLDGRSCPIKRRRDSDSDHWVWSFPASSPDLITFSHHFLRLTKKNMSKFAQFDCRSVAVVASKNAPLQLCLIVSLGISKTCPQSLIFRMFWWDLGCFFCSFTIHRSLAYRDAGLQLEAYKPPLSWTASWQSVGSWNWPVKDIPPGTQGMTPLGDTGIGYSADWPVMGGAALL